MAKAVVLLFSAVLIYCSGPQAAAATRVLQSQGQQLTAWQQCGGQGGCPSSAGCGDNAWTSVNCPKGYTCQRNNKFYWQCRPGTYKQQATAKPPVYAANLRFQSLDQTSKPAAAGSKSQNQQQNGAKSAPQQNKPKSSVDANGIVVQEVDESVINRMAAGAPQQQQQQRPQQQQQARPQQQPQQQSQQQPQLPGFFSLFG